ncbi:MAG: DUF3748 domain-containing protein [bacterium]|nr:DUF3748 domain-containing protein [bacterium]
MKINTLDMPAAGKWMAWVLVACASVTLSGCFAKAVDPALGAAEEQLTFDYKGHYLSAVQCFSPDDEWIVYDTRIVSGKLGLSGSLEKVNLQNGKMSVVYKTPGQTQYGPGVGAGVYNPVSGSILFTRGLANCNFLRPYGLRRRVGMMLDESEGPSPRAIIARDITPPFTAGALRGGTHEHTWSGDGRWISFTYQDAVLAKLDASGRRRLDRRTVGVCGPAGRVRVDHDANGENNDSSMFSVLVVRVDSKPRASSDQIEHAYGDSWVGTNGYIKPDGTRQKRAIAFQGIVLDDAGERVSEAFIVDLPDRIDIPGPLGPLEGTPTTRPVPPKGTTQRRLTHNTKRKYPGIQGPWHWLRSSPDGKWIAYLAKDDSGLAQIHLVSPNGGRGVQLTQNKWAVGSAFNWSPDGRYIAYAMDNSIFITDTQAGDTFGKSWRMTKRSGDERKPEAIGAIWSNRGDKIAFCRRITHAGIRYPQIFILTLRKK